MHQKGHPGYRTEVVLSDGQRFESRTAFAEALGIHYTTLCRQLHVKGYDPDTIARKKGLLNAPQLAAE